MKSVSIVGAGIAGLAHAYAFAKRGWRVRVYERSHRAGGASVRNFGMVWPIGQPAGELEILASESRALWLEILTAAKLPFWPLGSLHVAHREDEANVAREFAEREPHRARWIDAAETVELSPSVNPDGLIGALHSESEVVVDPRLILWTLPEFLDERYGVEFHFETAVTDVRQVAADRVIVCTGYDFATLYPRVLAASGLTRCKLQMLRTHAQPQSWTFGPALAGGLTLRFYSSFRACSSLGALRSRIAGEFPEYDRWGIHVMASQTADRAITIGDSHEYGLSVDVFNKEEIDELILRYLTGFARFPNMGVAQRWYGVYSKHPDAPYYTAEPEPGVQVVTGLGGAGMTLSFGLAETLVRAAEDGVLN